MKTTQFTNAKRLAILNERRNLKMARSAHAYVRGNTLKFYEWLQSSSGRAIPVGPPIWICGDCHLGNLGPLANVKGQVEIAIRDLDQTVIGNPAHDLIRLGISLATAARGSDLPGVTTAMAMEQMIDGYLHALSNRSQQYNDFDELPKPIPQWTLQIRPYVDTENAANGREAFNGPCRTHRHRISPDRAKQPFWRQSVKSQGFGDRVPNF